MFNDFFKQYGPTLIRYGLITLASALATHGLLSVDQQSYVSSHVDQLVGAVVLIGTILAGLWVRPSPAAMEAAKQIDKVVVPAVQADAARNGTAPEITIKTPIGQADVVVPLTKAA